MQEPGIAQTNSFSPSNGANDNQQPIIELPIDIVYTGKPGEESPDGGWEAGSDDET
jgi:hypothetical protein